MPAVSRILLNNLINRSSNTITNISALVVETAVHSINNPPKPLQVICSFPVSGQYGPGSRVLYYVLVAACLLARKKEWLRNACLAAALIFPAVAAIHGIVLAAIHVEGAIDMDIYGAFQFCSIGILTAPATVRLSTTYFNDPGRNTIFAWATLLLMGLLALTVEFFRSDSVDCKDPIFAISDFLYGKTMCNLKCSIYDGPSSPMRKGAADEIFVVPAPTILTFGTATLLSAACCIPAVLSMASMWDKILKINWKERFGDPDDEIIEGTNGATYGRMNQVNEIIRGLLSVIEIPLYAAAVVAILVIGERNFWSEQVYYQTEPMGNVGQWAPIVASGMAAFGSLYMLLAETGGQSPDTNNVYPQGHCNCSHHHSNHGDAETGLGIIPVINPERGSQEKEGEQIPTDAGKRMKIARVLYLVGKRFGTATHDPFEDGILQNTAANNFPRIPGEEGRNPVLYDIERVYNSPRIPDDDTRSRRSRANSFNGSVQGRSASRISSPNQVSSPGLLSLPPRIQQQAQQDANDPRLSSDSEPKQNTDLETPSPSALPGTTVTLHQSVDYPSITVSSEQDPVALTVPPPVHQPPS
ncbi:hypothetical protein QBC38DRAFT_148830 [Podospora fimiseda]|uniref:Uncharacterized protein n=1 Tax=Podospora fimiseda TaxID=252190 RepID=A0AAN7H0V3_9PEZI|nr:hypothetical protein QBC38DRAFT_148830 [Podospora fimiseda]